ncbi:hypothetical protein CCY99_00035 [Helicobacter sp. 16-1353]|uniref:tetratricopeptide repeat protein n=1 Tax=Helicobacter sp. 16-1353 TaxID=2004996 RepID=UPI000DCBEF76|nr:CDC27 family protein [Helicobacter sp. 16-1353]RAX55125.1 hypothetical protein CCY99_00035 [Helicobacter sp. 16-1353]
MYRRSKKIILAILLCFNINLFANALEDSYILEALDALDSNNYQGALEIYENLYNSTKKLEYLKEMINLSIQLGRFNDAINYIKDYEKINNNDINIKHSLAHSYMALNRIDDAIKVYREIVALDDNATNNKILSNLYFLKKDFNESRQYLLKVFQDEPNERILLLIVSIDIMNKNFNASIPLIKEYFPNGTSDEFSQIITELALNSKIITELESLYLYYYDKNPNEQNAENLTRVYMLNDKGQEALKLANKYKFDDNLMIDLYMMQKDYKNARILTKEAFNKTKDNTYLGILAIIDFEDASDKKSVLPEVIENFKKALSDKQNHIFYNYLGYLLIDFDVDIDEGIKYVNMALSLDPNNPAYLDSLAWGLYKKNDCNAAKNIMNRIPSNIVEKEDEIKEHLEMIEKCLVK